MNSKAVLAERKQVLSNARRIVVKVGSAVLTSEKGIALEVVQSLVDQISTLHDKNVDVVLVSSGAVAAGRGALRNLGALELKGMPDRQAASAIGQSRLMHVYDEKYSERGKVTAQVLLTGDDFKSKRRFLNACNTFDALLKWRAIPIVNENDTVMVKELEFGDNDSLAALLLNLVEADLFVNLTSADGVFTANPLIDPQAKHLDYINDVDALDLDTMCGGKTSVGSGGMYSKLLAASRAAQRGVPTLILAGREANAITRAFDGETLGTWVRAKGKKISRRKFRMAYNTKPSGSVHVDAGAAMALAERGKSLLPAGIVKVEGSFDRGALVRVVVTDGSTLGVGLTNYKAADLRRIAGKKSADIEATLGYNYLEAVHRDNLLLNAAI